MRSVLCVIVSSFILSLSVTAQPLQPAYLAPRETESGVLFQCRAPDATRVYLAGEFNDWADNQGGYIRDDRTAMKGPDENGVFRKTVNLPPGVYSYKLCIDGKPDGWFVPSYARTLDGDGNALVIADGLTDETLTVRDAQPPVIKNGYVTFELYHTDAHIIFLAGSFNNWANNDNGSVHDHTFAMQGPDENGIWRKSVRLTPGTYRYQFVINGKTWIPDPLVANVSSDDQSEVVVP